MSVGVKNDYYQESISKFISNSSLAGFFHLGANHWLESSLAECAEYKQKLERDREFSVHSVSRSTARGVAWALRGFCEHIPDIPSSVYGDGGVCEQYRSIWYTIHIISIACTIFLMCYSWNNFTTNPTVTTVEPFGDKILDVPMPGISVCTINKISKVKAQVYADYLSQKSLIPIADIIKNISLLGYLYQYDLPLNPDRVIYFQNFLEKYDSINGYFNTTDKLYQLHPSCDEVLKDCKWLGKEKKCSDLFITELTMDGFCCAFNYIHQRKYAEYPPIIVENNYKPLLFGPKKSLDFSLQSNSSDTLFTTLGTDAVVKLIISLHTDFPDTSSGGSIEKIIDKGSESILHISTLVTETTSEVRKYPVSKRQCMFTDEARTIFGSYSYSDCLVDCKLKSIIALCQCIPYNFINVYNNINNRYFQCTLADLSCLNSYSIKWKTQYPTGYEGSELEREKQDSIQCSHCVPSCSDSAYYLIADDANIFTNRTKSNISIVHIRYNRYIGVYNKQDVFFYWYDMLSMFGGLCSITMGLSFISVFELIYYFFWVIIKNIMKKIT